MRLILAKGDRIQAIHLSPRTIGLVGVCFALFSVLYFGATAYLFMRDDLLRSSGGKQEQLVETYEDRISALRNEIDRIKSRRLVDHATVEQKVDRLLDMQETLGERQEMLSRLTEAARRAGFDIPEPTATKPQASALPVAEPNVALAAAFAVGSSSPDRPAIAQSIDRVAGEITAMEGQQDSVVEALGGKIAGRSERIAKVLKRLGHKVPASAPADVGGPYVPASVAGGEDRFAEAVDSLAGELGRLATLRKAALSLPLKRPIANAPITSGFGNRLDPFLGRPAMHTGIDFRAPKGYPARAVAAGKVIAAEWNGGYGNMVDIDHGNGVVTRYGHLSSILVKVGDKVAAGGKIGRVGSTGRSTGPHLHYEIRIDGEAINPMRYLSAGQEIAALL